MVPIIPKRGEITAVLPVTAEWKVWKTWDMEVEGQRLRSEDLPMETLRRKFKMSISNGLAVEVGGNVDQSVKR